MHEDHGAAPPTSDGPDAMSMHQLGELLRSLRRDANMTLQELAERSGVSTGLISQIERGQGNPAYNTLIKLAQALGVKVGEFFGGPEPESHAGAHSAGLVRADQRRRLLLTERDMVYELLTPSMRGRLGVIRAQIAAGWSNESVPYRHDGEECIVLISGRLSVVVGSDRYELEEGDALTYDASIPHWYANITPEPAVIIGATTPPSF